MPCRALVIDDDRQIRELVTAILEAAGYQACHAAKGVEGLRLAHADPPDVVILDLQMPGMDGYEVLRTLRAGPRTHRIPVVMITASDDPALNRKAFEAGAQACVPKPFRREGLLAALRVALTAMPPQPPPRS